MKDFLTEAERTKLLSELGSERYAKYSDRLKSILLLDEGETVFDISKFLFLSEKTIRNYKNRYLEGGIEFLILDNYTGKECKLTDLELEKLINHLSTNLYRTVIEIQDYILSEFNIEYSTRGLRHLLKREGFVYKRPKLIPGKANKIDQEKAVRSLKYYKRTDNPMYFMDGVHPQHNTKANYGWIKKGEDFNLKSNTGRKRVNINGAINANDPTDFTYDEADSINTQSTIRVFKKVEKKNPNAKQINIVTDNARYYKCKLVKEFLKNSKIKIVFLPAYSPNLNLIERLWRVMNRKIIYNIYFEDYLSFKNSILDFFNNIKNYEDEVYFDQGAGKKTESYEITV